MTPKDSLFATAECGLVSVHCLVEPSIRLPKGLQWSHDIDNPAQCPLAPLRMSEQQMRLGAMSCGDIPLYGR